MSAAALHVVAPAGAGQTEPGTLDWIASRLRENLELRVAVGDYSPRSLKRTLSYVLNFTSWVYQGARIGSLHIEQAQQFHFTNWLVAHFDRWQKGSTRADACGSVLGCFNWAEEERLIPRNPFRKPRRMKFPRQHRRAMRERHFRAIDEAAGRCAEGLPLRRILFFCWHTGSRLKEARVLEWDEIEWETGIIRLDVDKNKTGRKTGQQRIFAASPACLVALRELYDRRKEGQKRVFLTKRGKPWTKDNLGRRFAHYRKLAGVPESIMLCGTRHGYAVRLKVAGEDSKAVADQLGHKGTRMVDTIYGDETRFEADHLRGVGERAERAIKPAAGDERRQKEASDFPLFDGL